MSAFLAFAHAALRAGRITGPTAASLAQALYPFAGYNLRLWRVTGGFL